MTATIIGLDGRRMGLNEWQKVYGLTVGTAQLGRHLTIGEPNVRLGLTISEAIIRLFDGVRALRGRALYVNSLDRSQEKQEELQRNPNIQAAKYSPHVVKLAIDIDTTSNKDTAELLEVINTVADVLGYRLRLGWESYQRKGQTFIHIDVCPMYYGKNGVWHDVKHPLAWEGEIEW